MAPITVKQPPIFLDSKTNAHDYEPNHVATNDAHSVRYCIIDCEETKYR